MPRTRRKPGTPKKNPEQISLAAIEALIAQRVVDVIASLETPRNVGSGGNGGKIPLGDNQFSTIVIYHGTMVLNTDLIGSENIKRNPDENLEQVAWKEQDLGKIFVANISSPTPLR
ncbi:unnamed protein product [Lactuca saligna]|uniref:Uncharacterized protein n=1 Tax=Lactuca saligna TaxID=75948 RepID=A0AA35YWK2_LACSI|nr:unnamed protein product [Lactuca saligna]